MAVENTYSTYAWERVKYVPSPRPCMAWIPMVSPWSSLVSSLNLPARRHTSSPSNPQHVETTRFDVSGTGTTRERKVSTPEKNLSAFRDQAGLKRFSARVCSNPPQNRKKAFLYNDS